MKLCFRGYMNSTKQVSKPNHVVPSAMCTMRQSILNINKFFVLLTVINNSYLGFSKYFSQCGDIISGGMDKDIMHKI